MEEGEEVGDGRAGGSATAGDGGQAAILLTPDVDGTDSDTEPHACQHLCKFAT